MTVQEVIDELMKIEDKSKEIKTVYCTGQDFDGSSFIEEGIVAEISDEKDFVVLMDDMKFKYDF